MRYSKIIRKNMLNKRIYLIVFMCCFLLVMIFDTLKGTAAFGNCMKACMNAPYRITYSPNYPEGYEIPESVIKSSCEYHKVQDNQYEIPNGYTFSYWNTEADGSGISYYPYMCVPVESSFILYAQWVKNKEEEEKVITYGDLNNNGDIDEDDYLTLEKYLSDSSVLSSDQVISADVNGDDTVNNIDVDIIKHAYLGTSGYVGYLPYSIVPIYSLYEGDAIEGDNSSTGNGNDNSSDTNTEDNNNSDNVTEDNKDNESSSEDLSDNKTNNSSNNSSSSDTNNDNEDKESESEKREDTDKKEENKQPIIYEFKFMNENKEYSKTTCIATDSGTCELAIPTYDPVKEGYKFSGWSLDKECSNEALFTGPISVNKSNIYYACFVVDSGDKKNYSFLTVSLILIAVWGITGLTMYKIIKRFKEKNSKN